FNLTIPLQQLNGLETLVIIMVANKYAFLQITRRRFLVDIFTFYVPHRHVYGEQWIKFMKDGVNATPLPTVNTTGYIDHAAFLGTINPDTNKIPKHLFQGYLNIYNNYFKAPWMPD